jgi:hypothetical protein
LRQRISRLFENEQRHLVLKESQQTGVVKTLVGRHGPPSYLSGHGSGSPQDRFFRMTFYDDDMLPLLLRLSLTRMEQPDVGGS